MGAQIALHFANAGIPSLLLDLTADVARQGLDKARKLKPDPQFTPEVAALVTTGGFETHLDQIAARRLGDGGRCRAAGYQAAAAGESRRAAAARHHRLDQHVGHPDRRAGRRPLRGLPPALDRHPLLQPAALSPPPGDSSRRRTPIPAVVAAVTRVGDLLLGKGVVVAKDTPNFIGNHIALYGVASMLRALASGRYSIEEIDAITGPAIGRPGLRDVPDDGHRRRRRPGARHAQPARAAGRMRATATPSSCRRSSTR